MCVNREPDQIREQIELFMNNAVEKDPNLV